MTSRQIINLWPAAAAGSEDWTHDEIEFTAPFADQPDRQWQGVRNVRTPSMTVYRPTTPNGSAVLVCPGGGYRILAYDYEGIDIAEWFAARGVTAFLLKYRVEPTPPDPEDFAKDNAALVATIATDIEVWIRTLDAARKRAVADGVQAMKLIRQRAAEFGVNPSRVGVIGFSAGAGVTVGVALSEPATRPNWAAPIYGGDRGDAPVPADAPPLFIVVSQNDPFRLAPECIRLYQRWIDGGAKADLHVYSDGGHGYGMRKLGLTTDHWPALLDDWLRKLEVLAKDS